MNDQYGNSHHHDSRSIKAGLIGNEEAAVFRGTVAEAGFIMHQAAFIRLPALATSQL
jgi:hypothetical protein